MGERTSGVNRSPEQLEHEVESIRAGMEPVIAELDHRRHELAGQAAKLRQQAPGLIRKAMFVMAVIGTARMLLRMRANRRQRSHARMRAY